MEQVNIHEAKSTLSKLVEKVSRGEEIIIARNGKPVARLVAVGRAAAPRKAGQLRGRITIGEDFDAPLPAEIGERLGEPSTGSERD